MSYIAVEAYRGFRRNLLLALSMVIIVAISLTLFGIALLAGKQVALYGGYWADKIEVSIFLTQGVTQEQKDSISAELNSLKPKVVQNVFFENQQDAYARFKEQFKDSPDMVRNVGPDALPESSCGKRSALSCRPTSLSTSGMVRSIECRRAPITSSAKATFSRTVLFDRSLKSWNTQPIARRSAGTLDRKSVVRERV